MAKPSFDEVWARIKSCQGQAFRQIRGKEFSYRVDGATVILSTTNQNLPRAQFEKAYELCPLSNTVPVHHLRGPSYLYAILMDPHIRRAEW